jgi:hypothetical protein
VLPIVTYIVMHKWKSGTVLAAEIAARSVPTTGAEAAAAATAPVVP